MNKRILSVTFLLSILLSIPKEGWADCDQRLRDSDFRSRLQVRLKEIVENVSARGSNFLLIGGKQLSNQPSQRFGIDLGILSPVFPSTPRNVNAWSMIEIYYETSGPLVVSNRPTFLSLLLQNVSSELGFKFKLFKVEGSKLLEWNEATSLFDRTTIADKPFWPNDLEFAKVEWPRSPMD